MSSYQKSQGVGAGVQYSSIDDATARHKGCIKWSLGVLFLIGVGIAISMVGPPDNKKVINNHMKNSSPVQVKEDGSLALFDSLNRYVLEDYDAKSTWTSFLPGVAGYFGKPVWAFYVNRGQAIATFGTESKDYPILEFNPANKAYQLTPFLGFRTFVRGSRGGMGGSSFETEPFAPSTARTMAEDSAGINDSLPKRILFVGTNEVEIQEIDGINGLGTNVQYFVLPEEDYASLVRRTTFSNLGDTALTFEALDGLARMEPYGGALDWGLKNMGKTLEGWMGVYFEQKGDLTKPFYKLSTETSDSAQIKIEENGHYCVSFIEDAWQQSPLLPIVYDTAKVFGKDTSFNKPRGWMASSVEEILSNDQFGWAKTSSAFAALTDITLKPGENITIATVFGKATHISEVGRMASHMTTPGYIARKFERARSLANELTRGVDTTTVNPLFDGTVKQMFLDNGLRGGYPTIMGNVNDDTTYDEDPQVKVFHSFSRIHGDLERDYNAFKIDPTYYSQGPGNYRDIAQNRRNDVTFYPRMGSFDVQMFLSYIQADGYEPLTVEAVVFRYEDPDKAAMVAKKVTNDAKSAEVLQNVLNGGPFRPGQLFELCELLDIHFSVSKEEFINTMVAHAEDRAMAVYGQGYWADHWDYYLDLIEAYLAVFPDGEEALMYDKPLRYFFSTATVKPRSRKYILTLTYDGKSEHVQQLDATYFDDQKVKEQEAFRDQNTGLLDSIEANWQRTVEGKAFKSSAISKLFLLGSMKFSMRDAWGCGIEYEGGRPGWLDSMNGLPGMVGSGMPETYELLLLLQYVKKVVSTYKRPIVIPSELNKMIITINSALDTLLAAGVAEPTVEDFENDVPKPLFEYWDVVTAARENYRNDVEYYFSGNTTTLKANAVVSMIDRWLDQIELGIQRSFKIATFGHGDDGKSGIPATFFAYEITKWEKNNNKSPVGLPCVNALAMKVKKFPLFLEGPVRYMKTIIDDKDKMLDVYNRVKTSGLRDEFLNMYFLSASLEGQTFDMGRQIAFAPGWLENQSIWMHMSYKYYLQLIRGKLYEQFFSEMREDGGILPFMDPDVYGRSLMECSSFIASSAFPDPSIVGEGFLARLSGSTAEFMDMWKFMFIGPKLFSLDDNGKLQMTLLPALPSWLFQDDEGIVDPLLDEDGNHTVSFKLFATIRVTYHNPGGVSLYGVPPKKYKVIMKDNTLTVDGPSLDADTAAAVRRMTNVISIDAYF
ncbi:hypothetical protein ACA910_001648 [Epithemia clementina (nom. ined.)]